MVYFSNANSTRASILYVAYFVTSAAPRFWVRSNENLAPGSSGLSSGSYFKTVGGWCEGSNVQTGRYRSAKVSLNLSNSGRSKAAGLSRFTEFWSSNVQLFKRTGDIISRSPLPQRGSGREQEVELPSTDKPDVSDADACVFACGGWFPGSFKISDFQWSSGTIIDETMCYHKASPKQRKSICLGTGGLIIRRWCRVSIWWVQGHTLCRAATPAEVFAPWEAGGRGEDGIRTKRPRACRYMNDSGSHLLLHCLHAIYTVVCG